MTEIMREVSIDLSRRSNVRLIFARQNDMNSRRLRIKLTDGGVPYSVPIGDQAVINIKRADGESAAFAAEVGEDGCIYVTLTLWMLSVPGETKCAVSLYDGAERKLTSADIMIDVAESLYVGDDIAQDVNYSLLTDLMSEMSQYKSSELERVEAENNRASNEEIRVQNEHARNYSENKRNSAEIERENAEIERKEHFAELCGRGGQVTLKASDWKQGLSAKLTLDGLTERDMVNFYPRNVKDRTLLDDHAVFFFPITDGNTVNISAEITPSEDIELCYFIIKGGV